VFCKKWSEIGYTGDMNGGTVFDVKKELPVVSMLAMIALLAILYWFVKGGSFVLYGSLFFGIYFLTQSSWVSIILVSVAQNVLLLPMRILYEKFHDDIKDFEYEIKESNANEQQFMISKKVRQGSGAVIFYVINFVLVMIAFFSASRVFLLEFYKTPIDASYLYSFIHYPEYPLKGVIFHFPLIHITRTVSVDWYWIFYVWGALFIVMTLVKLLWRIVKPIFSKNEKLLGVRINYNRFLVLIGGLIGTFMIVSTIFLRNIPIGAELVWWSADLAEQNTAFNIVTAICSFFATLYSGYQHNKLESEEARARGVPENIIEKVARTHTRSSVKNGIMLGLMALWVTRLMPCSHDLSVLAFEACYVLSPVTFDLLIPKKKKVIDENLTA